MYTGVPNNLPASVQPLIKSTVGHHIVLIQATSAAGPSTDVARNIVKALRADPGVSGGQVLVGGETAVDLDVIQFIYGQVPWAAATGVLLTYVLLFLLTRSLALPLHPLILT